MFAIFDLDGTLIDFEGVSARAIGMVTEARSKLFTEELHSSILGTPSSHWAAKLIRDLELSDTTVDQFLNEYYHHMSNLYPTMELMPGAASLLSALKDRNIPIAIATSSASKTISSKLSPHPIISESVSLIVTGDDPELTRGKPNPDIFLLAAKRLGANPSQCVVFEDAPSGVRAGMSAGMRTVAIPDYRYLSRDDLFFQQPLDNVSIFNTLEEFDIDSYFPPQPTAPSPTPE